MPSDLPRPLRPGEAAWDPSAAELGSLIKQGERWFTDHGLRLPAVDIGGGLDIQVPYRTALSVAAGTSEHPDWLVSGFVALQAITELDGKVKSSGKTTWATHLVAAILDGDRFMGYATTRTKVVYLTEQTQGSFREALSRAGLKCSSFQMGTRRLSSSMANSFIITDREVFITEFIWMRRMLSR